ncbi:Stage II sporulation protein E (SpoIIE) [Streptomyces reticuli]|nr:Stage II sporulation protein E (SpoIIE) [Streptomyces reticuli]
MLPPLPERVGRVGCAAFYRAAQDGTLVGGDFFDVRQGPYGVRAVMGDVQGHGLSAVATVVSLLGAFREAALDQPDLESVAARLDRRLAVDSADVRHAELFATALLLEFAAGSAAVHKAVRALGAGAAALAFVLASFLPRHRPAGPAQPPATSVTEPSAEWGG